MSTTKGLAVDHKDQVRQFFQTSDVVKSGVMENGCVIGQVWDGGALQLRRAGGPVRYMAPQEGAQSWIDGLSLSARAQNEDAAYELLKFLYTPEISAMLTVEAGYNGVMADAADLLADEIRELFVECYPGDALDLGASPLTIFLTVKLPFLRPALNSSVVLPVPSSVEVFNATTFTILADKTLTTVLAGRIRAGLSPEVSALAVIIIGLTRLGALACESSRVW